MSEEKTIRKTWLVILIFLVTSPVVGMLYLGRWFWAFVYLLLGFAIIYFTESVWQVGPFSPQGAALLLFFVLIGMVHGSILSHRKVELPAAKAILGSILTIVAFASGLCFVFFFGFLNRPFAMTATSMLPTLNAGDYLLADKRAYREDKPVFGDVIIFWSPSLKNYFVKRVAGLPGDRVQMKQGELYINDEKVARKELPPFEYEQREVEVIGEYRPDGRMYRTLNLADGSFVDDTNELLVPENHYFVLGDNRDNSSDSRLAGQIGFVDEADIIGRATYIYWDNRKKETVFRPIDELP
ncbi:MAG: signal peptidase I [Rhizobiales bacterium]|nr:signal peptidase I [Hyphomicrobiales bacterium]